MRSIVSGDYYRNFNIGIHKETPLRSKLCGRTSPARYLLPSVVSAGTNQVVSHHHHRRSQPAELAWGSVGLGKQLDPYRGSEGRADPIWLSVVNRDSDRNAKTSAHLLAFPFITYKLHELGHYGMGHQINSEFVLATGQGISENDKR